MKQIEDDCFLDVDDNMLDSLELEGSNVLTP